MLYLEKGRDAVWSNVRNIYKSYGHGIIHAMHEALGEGSIIAEDLGYLTPEVKAMLSA